MGKSTLLRLIAGLTPYSEGEVSLCGKSQSSFEDMSIWRKQVLYVPQTKVEIPGSPRQLLRRISSFQVWKSKVIASPSLDLMTKDVERLVDEFEAEATLLDSEWKSLSGGESQRILLAMALASRPKVILLDESVSGLDFGTKVKVEKSIEDECQKHSMCAIWITHDRSQQERLHLR